MRTGALPQCQRIVLLGALCSIAILSAAQVSVTTYHNDNARTGHNTAEALLTPANVNSSQFGKLFSVALDGYVYAQPLYMANVPNIAGGTHNVVYVATEHDSLYAIDADNGVVLWQQSFISPSGGITTVSSGDVSCGDLVPEIGITSTPVIDPASGTIYLLARTKENGAYFQRLHALDIASHTEKFGGPVVIAPTFQGGTFDPLKENNRPGLLLENGHVVIAWASHCDNGPYQGWMVSYNAATLAQEAVFNTEPDPSRGFFGGIWMSGDGVASDANGNLYFATGNGDYNSATGDYGDSIVKLSGPSGGSFAVADWFTPFNQNSLNGGDTDVGSGGLLLLPTLTSGTQLLVQMGKEGKIYLIDRNNMGKFCSTCTSQDTQIVQELPGASGGIWGSPAFWNNTVYWGGGNDGGSPEPIKAWSFNANNSGLLSTSPVSQSTQGFSFSTAAPVISANGTSNGILWILDNSSFRSSCCQVLYAYDATNLGTMLYNSNQAANNRDVPGGSVKFTAPIVANGKVYVGSQGTLTAFGAISSTTAATPTFSPAPGSYNSAQSVTISDTTPGMTIYYTTDGSTPTTSSPVFKTPIAVTTNTTIKAMATAPGYNNSAVATGVYVINATAGIGFVQVNSGPSTIQSSNSSVSVAYGKAQTAGDLNIVVVSWGDNTSTISSVTDSLGNTYSRAVGPTSTSGLQQSIYYAKNIAGGNNTVKVTFNQAAAYPDVRILEYSGLSTSSPLDVTAAAVGSGSSASSGSATTSGNELIFGAGTSDNFFSSAGSGFTNRIVNIYGNLAEDKVVSSSGSYAATATNSGNTWVMQMATFKAASLLPAPTVTGVSPNSGPAAGGTAITISGTNFVSGATATLGGTAATNAVVVNSTTITATTAAHAAAAVTVTVTNPDTQSGSLTNGFTYTSLPAPTVTGVNPNSGPAAGGTAITISGTNFVNGATATLGGTGAANVVVVNSTTITAKTAAHAAGAVKVTVTNPDTQSGSLANGYTYNATISFVQVSSGPSTIQSSNSLVSVAYGKAQTAGDLNIVVVSWGDNTSTISSVTDSLGNSYSRAVGPTSTSGLQQSIYYAKNIVGGNNTVRVTFNQAAAYPDVRILEYSGLSTSSPLDVTAAAVGSGSSASSGSATTTSGNELIFGAGTSDNFFSSAGSGFTNRIVNIYGNLAEDEVVSSSGGYAATATNSGNTWVMQMATFK